MSDSDLPNLPQDVQPDFQIAPVPLDRRQAALELLFTDSTADVRTDQIRRVDEMLGRSPPQADGLLAAWLHDRLLGVCFLQVQCGRVANLMPPKCRGLARADSDRTIGQLIAAALRLARSRDCTMVQCLLETNTGPLAQLLLDAGFRHATDLLYLVSMSGVFPTSPPANDLKFIPVVDDGSPRFAEIVEQTYQGTLDCPTLNGVRSTADVLAGYGQIGSSQFPLDGSKPLPPRLWWIVRQGNVDVGCLLMADHAADRCWELVYMGVVPTARGRGLGIEIARHAQWLAGEGKVDRLVLAADADNIPALDLYARAGFVAWDRRSVLLNILSQG